MNQILKSLIVLSVLCCANVSAVPSAELLVRHLDQPVQMVAPQHNRQYFYILEKKGLIKVYDRKSKQILKQPFLDIRSKIKIKMNEQGLLNMVFSPNFDQNNRFYLYYTDNNGDAKIARYTASTPLLADKSSEEILIKQKQDYRNHNGGWIDFGPDGMLYIGLGDGGSANDPKRRSQNLRTFLGKILRIDVRPGKGYTIPKNNPYYAHQWKRSEILCHGLRNPWRCHWQNNSLWIADVGQNAWEEINFVSYDKLFGADFGWPAWEGHHRTKQLTDIALRNTSRIRPIYNYKHDGKNTGGYSITGGVVYAGSVNSLTGRYLFADYVKPKIWSGFLKNGKLTDIQHHTNQIKDNGKKIAHIASFATDSDGETYIVSHDGTIHKIVDR